MIQLTPEQTRAGMYLRDHLGRVGGYAGTGKSVTTAWAARMLRASGRSVVLATPTNKAAAVLRKMAPDLPVYTLHSLTTTPAEVPDRDEDGEIIGTKMVFTPKEEKISEHVIIDEASMLGGGFFGRIERNLTSYSMVGDPYQLPPVKDEQIFTESSCDQVLRQVMRQAAESPALAFATALRNCEPARAQDFGVVVTDGIQAADLEPMGDADAICITFTNYTRHWFNKEIRKARTGRNNWRPNDGDKVICRETDPETGLFKGLTGVILETISIEDDRVEVRVEWDLDSEHNVKVHTIDARNLAGKEIPWDDRFGTQIEYGYAVTCHSAQGSSWDRVYIVPDIKTLIKTQGLSGMRRWMYTAVTRVNGTGEVKIVDNR